MNRRRPSKAELAAAWRHWNALHEPEPPPENESDRWGAHPEPAADTALPDGSQDTTRAAVLEEFRRAKLAYHAATLAVLAREAFAAERADDALRRLNQARAELERLGDVELGESER